MAPQAVGGGIAGLTVVRALGSAGVDVDLVERAEEWQTEGTGLFTPPNGLHALKRLGLADQTTAMGAIVKQRRFETGNGSLVTSVDLEEVWGAGRFGLGVHRQALHDVLLAGAHDASIALGVTVSALEADSTGVRAQLSDGRDERYDLVSAPTGIAPPFAD